MSDRIATILRLVADGQLSPDEAAPIIEALAAASEQPTIDRPAVERGQALSGRRGGEETQPVHRHLRIRVTERGRQVVNLRIPMAFADAAIGVVPGLSELHAERIRAAIAAGIGGPIIDVEDEDGDGVLISTE